MLKAALLKDVLEGDSDTSIDSHGLICQDCECNFTHVHAGSQAMTSYSHMALMDAELLSHLC